MNTGLELKQYDRILASEPEQIIKEANKKYDIKKYIGLFSGGKDSLAVCHYMWKNHGLKEVLYCKTGIGTKENFEFVQHICEKYGWKLNILEPTQRWSYDTFVKMFGFPGGGMHNTVMFFLKWKQIRDFCKKNNNNNEGIMLVSGRRKKESGRRKRMKSLLPYENPEKRIYMLSPFYYMTTSQVLEYSSINKLEKCPVYETLHMSGDCLCGSFSELGESELIKTFHPDLAKQILDLEKKYNGKWGNHVSMSETIKQNKLSQYVCSDCYIDRDIG